MTEPTMFTRPDDTDDDKPLIYLPPGAQIHHHDGTKKIPEDWEWLTGRKEKPE